MSEPEREIIIELQRIDDYVRVCAVDVATGTEVISIGSARASEQELKSLGVRKLLAVMEQAKRSSDKAGENKTPPTSGRGRLV